MPVLLDDLSDQAVQTFGLVLTASRISYWIGERDGKVALYVKDQDYRAAQLAITAYLRENPDQERNSAFEDRVFQKTYSAMWICGVLIAIHVIVLFIGQHQQIVQTYGASASKILRGELYRTVTALTLHSGPLHLMGNLLGLAVFGTALCGITGWGVGWALILLSGIFGNFFNAYFYKTAHLSIGASTALFGAVGLVSVEHVVWKLRKGRKGSLSRALMPLGGGLALLGLLGASEQSDVMAHFFGFISGCVLSIFYTFIPRESLANVSQRLYGYGAGILFLGSWLAPLFITR